MNAIEVDRVSKVFGAGAVRPGIRALDGVTLRLRPGEVVGLLGPNGSGKSTLLKIVLGLVAPSAGECRLFGWPASRVEARAAVGYLPEAPGFDPHATGFEVVRFFARLGGGPAAGLKERVARAMARVGLAAVMHRRVGTYSHGMRQRLGWAQALVHDPKLVILDEPMTGLDPVGIAEAGRLIRELRAAGRSVLFTSHGLEQVAEVCDAVVILNGGRIVLDSRVEDLTRRAERVALIVDLLPPALLAELQRWLQARGITLHAAERSEPEWEQVFLEAVGGGGDRLTEAP